MTVTVTDAHSNKLIGSDTVTDKMLRGVIEGVNVHLAPITGVNVRYDEKLGKMQYSAVDNYTALLHVANTESVVGMSANEGQLLDISIGRLDSVGLEVTDVYVTSVEEAQKSVTKVDEALVRLSKARSLVGAQVVKLEFSLKSLNTARQNMMSSASRLMDLDVAAESANLARNQILTNSSIAMLAQANQIPQLALQLLNG
ncbi:flagellin [Deferribacterales bacterium RsTz2092]|nr:hypothetical protein AGMMS49941_12330 [Deferribacterales bacterium]